MADEIYEYFPKKAADLVPVLHRMREEGVLYRDQYGKNWDRNVGLIRGDMWPDPASRPLFLAPIISPAVKRKAGLLAEAKPGLDVKPRKNGLQATAEVLKLTSIAIWDEQSASLLIEMISYYLATFGCGFFKVTYDQAADYGVGDILLTDVDPRLMIVDPAVKRSQDIQSGQYLIEESVVPYSWVQKTFPKTAKDVQPNLKIRYETNDTHKISWFARFRERMKSKTNPADSAVPRVYLTQNWIADPTTDKKGNLIYPKGRRIWMTDDDVILNPSEDPSDLKYGQANPYWDGMFPYVMLDNEPDMDHPYGHAEVEALRKIQEAFNTVGDVTTRVLLKNVPVWVADKNAIDSEVIQDLKELQELVVEKSPGRTADRVPPTQPSSTSLDFMRLMITLTEMQVGLNDGAMQGKGRVELRSQPQLEGLQQSAQVLVRSQARRLESSLERLGQMLISRIFQFYTDDRLMTYIDNGKMKEYSFQKDQLQKEILTLAFAAEEEAALVETNENLEDGLSVKKALVEPDFEKVDVLEALHGAWKLFRFKVTPFSTLASTKLARAAALQQLVQANAFPMSLVVQEAGFDNPDELMEMRLKEIQKMQALGFPPPPDPSKDKKKK